jgi:two-component system LytT family response regulator
MIRAIIVDDETKSREVLKRLLQEVDLDIDIVGEGDSVESGFEVITKEKPQLVFLDVEMLDGTGFNLLEKFDQVDFSVIFTTAYDKYAIKAFKYSAIDYLLKPIGIEELEDAVFEVQKGINIELNYHAQIKALINNSKETGVKKLAIKGANKIDFIIVDDILYCESEESYCLITMVDNRKITASKPLKHFDTVLAEHADFFRASKSCLINIKFIRSFVKSKDIIELTNGYTVEVSRRRRKEFLEKMEAI